MKNTLTVVSWLATNTLRRSCTMDQFSTAFLGRIHGLADAYTLL